jgi:hypothetical protein
MKMVTHSFILSGNTEQLWHLPWLHSSGMLRCKQDTAPVGKQLEDDFFFHITKGPQGVSFSAALEDLNI